MPKPEPRRFLLETYRHALAAVNGRACTAAWLRRHPVAGERAVLAVGKAAPQMAAGVLEVLGARVSHGLVVTKYGHLPLGCLEAWPAVRVLESAHPLPDANSLAAGAAALEFLRQLPPALPLLVLLSGGASALLEALPEGLSLAELQRANAWLLGSGLDIHAINRVRKRLSRLKGGGLARYLGERETCVLLISDVPGDALDAIGSGPLWPHPPQHLPEAIPAWLRQLCALTPPPPPSAYARIRHHLVATAAHARAAAARYARAHGHWPLHLTEGVVSEDAADFGQRLGRGLVSSPAGLWLASAETTLRLPPQPGRGGRCQHLALAAALELAGHPGTYVLAAGSDGGDGPGEDAGALVDAGSVARGQAGGRDPRADLAAADAGGFLHASGDLLRTGPTATNVMDLVLGLRC